MVRGRVSKTGSLKMRNLFSVSDSEMVFDENFNQTLSPDMFQDTRITSITFNSIYNKPIPPNVIPGNILSIRFGDLFNQPISPETFPESVETIVFGDGFNNIVTLPTNLQEVVFGRSFNKSVEIPTSVRHVRFGKNFNQPLTGMLREGIVKIEFGKNFNQLISPGDIPNTVTEIIFGANFQVLPLDGRYGQSSLDGGSLPDGIQKIGFKNNSPILQREMLRDTLTEININYRGDLKTYSRDGSGISIEDFIRTTEIILSDFPSVTLDNFWNIWSDFASNNMELLPVFSVNDYDELIFNDDFDGEVTKEMLHDLDIDMITFGRDFNTKLGKGVIPDGVRTVVFGDSFNQVIVPGTFPNTVSRIHFGRSFKVLPLDGRFGQTCLRPGSLPPGGLELNFEYGIPILETSVIETGRDNWENITEINIKAVRIYLDDPEMIIDYVSGIDEILENEGVPDEFWNAWEERFSVAVPQGIRENFEEDDEDEVDERNRLIQYESGAFNLLSDEVHDIPLDEWEEIKDAFEAAFGADGSPMDIYEVRRFLNGIWGDILENPLLRPVWADRIHTLLEKYTDVMESISSSDLNVRIPDLRTYQILLKISDKYRMGNPKIMDELFESWDEVRSWEHHQLELAQELLLESYSSKLTLRDKHTLRYYLRQFLNRVRDPFSIDVYFQSSINTTELTFDHLMVGRSLKISLKDIVKTSVSGENIYIVQTRDGVHELEFEDFDLRRMLVNRLESARAGAIIMKNPNFSIPISGFRRLPRSVITNYIKGKFDKVYERYAPESPHHIDINVELPPVISELLRPDETVLSGGRLLKAIAGDFSSGKEPSELARKMNAYVGMKKWSEESELDYDIYTTKSMEEINEYFLERGYSNRVSDPDLAEAIMSYGGWLTRYNGPNDERIDVIHVRQHVVFDRPICERPQDFISREFDIDITKAWYDGEKVSCTSQKTYQNIIDRKMTFDFHPMMTINQYKTRTTMGRIMKYESRGFEFSIQNNNDVIEKFMDRLTVISLLATRKGGEYPDDMLVSILERFEEDIKSARDQVMEYDKYYVKVREDEFRFRKRIPQTPLVDRPREHLFLARVIRRHVDRAGVFDDFFRRVLGISVYEFTGGVYGMGYDKDIYRIKPSWKNHVHQMNPGIVLKNPKLKNVSLTYTYRWNTPEFDTPRCTEVFTVGDVQPEGMFKDKISEYINKCKEMEVIQNCTNYIEDIFKYIIYMAFERQKVVRGTLNVTRGDELLNALANIDRMHLRFKDYFVKYAGEAGIDAGGPAKEFLMAVTRQIRPLFEYVNEDAEDKRMFISSLSDQEIIDNINRNLTTKSLTVDDLPMLYKLAGILCRSAIVNKFNTNIPFSRVLLTIMTSGDMGIDTDAVTSAFILEGSYNLDQYIMSELYSYEGSVEESALDKYLISNETKRRYIDMFANGFGDMSSVLKFFKVAGHELYMAICGNKVTIESFEAFFTNPSRITFKQNPLDFVVFKDDLTKKISVRVSGGGRAGDILMRGLSYTFKSEDGMEMYITDKLDSSAPTIYALLGRNFTYTIPQDAPDTLFLRVAGESSYVEYRVTDSDSLEDLKTKFIDFVMGKTKDERLLTRVRGILSDKLSGEDQELIAYLRGMIEALDAPPEPNLMTDEQIITLYYQLVISTITSFNVIGKDTEVNIVFTQERVQLFPHTCFSTLEVSQPWFANTSFEDWLETGLPAFFEKGFTAG